MPHSPPGGPWRRWRPAHRCAPPCARSPRWSRGCPNRPRDGAFGRGAGPVEERITVGRSRCRCPVGRRSVSPAIVRRTMVERVTALDASFLYLEERDTPMHVGGVLLLEAPPDGVTAIESLVAARLPLVPRYRQRVLEVPGHLAHPVWADDPDFDVDYHVRRSALPRPGTEEQLLELVSRLMSRPLDRRRPLWELYLVEGLSGNRVAVVTKTHPALVDGLSAIDIGQVLLDVAPDVPPPAAEPWAPQPPPSTAELVTQALEEYVRRPSAVLDTVRNAVTDVRANTARLA